MYDRYNVDTEFALMNSLLQISTWSVKGIEQAESMMREANGEEDGLGDEDEEGHRSGGHDCHQH